MNKLATTAAIIKNQKNEILLIKRGREPHKGLWSLISGIGESRKGLVPKEAILGEVFGDIGTSLLNQEELFSIGIGGDQFTDEVIVFTGNVDELEIKLKQGYSEAFKWFTLEEALEQNMAFEHKDILIEYNRLLQN